jgi:NTP pyrophosphatase (non-canonical NTP hydrolase)
MHSVTETGMVEAINALCSEIHSWAIGKGFWPWEYNWNFAEKIALIHSELSEALEIHRNPGPFGQEAMMWWTDKIGNRVSATRTQGACEKPEGIAIELADAVIRIMDLCGKMEIDLGRAILDKMEYNRTRPHKHGKAY